MSEPGCGCGYIRTNTGTVGVEYFMCAPHLREHGAKALAELRPAIPPAEIRQAVAFGKQAMLREVIDALHAERALRYGARNQRERPAGWREATAFLKTLAIEGEPKR